MEKNLIFIRIVINWKNHESSTITYGKKTGIISGTFEKKTSNQIKDIYFIRNGWYQIINIFLFLHNFPVKQRHQILRFHANDDKKSSNRKGIHKIKINSRKINVVSHNEKFDVYAATWHHRDQSSSTWRDIDNTLTPVCDKEEIFWKISGWYWGDSFWEESNRNYITISDSVYEWENG